MHKYLLLFAFFVAVHTATLPVKTVDIPVIVLYDDYFEGAKIRRSPSIDNIKYHGNGVRNLDAKVQLSGEELAVAAKYLRLEDAGNNVIENQPELPQKHDESTYQALGESSTASVITTVEENHNNPNYVLLVQIAQSIVASGLNNIREGLDNLGGSQTDGNKNPTISGEQWDRLNKTITSFFSSLLQRSLFKSAGDRNVVVEIVTGFKGATDDFVESLRSEAVTEKPQKPAPGPNIINRVTSGFQQIAANLGNIGFRTTTETTVLGDPPATTAPFAPFQNFINGIQQFFGGQPTTKAPGQGGLLSTVVPGGLQQGAQNLIDQLGQGAGVSLPTITPPQEQGTNPIQQGVSNVINQVASLNPINQIQSTVAPGVQPPNPPTNGPLQQVQSFFSNAGQTINNLFQGGTQQEGQQPNRTGPFQQVIHNVQTAVNSVLNPSTSPPGAEHEGQTTQRPFQSVVQGVQNFGNQVFSNLNPFNRPPGGTGAPGALNEGGTTAAPNGPFQQAIHSFQNIANQIGAALTGSTTAKPASSPTVPNQNGVPLTLSQSAVGGHQGHGASSLNPSYHGSTASPTTVTDKIGNVANVVNSLNQGSQLGHVPDQPPIEQETISQGSGSVDVEHKPSYAGTKH